MPALPPLLRTHPYLTTTALALLPLALWAHASYRAYLALGPGGLPASPLGWLVSGLLLRALSADPLSLAPYADPTLPERDHRAYLSSETFPVRVGPRPPIGAFPVPQRQVGDGAPAEVARVVGERYQALLENVKEIEGLEVRPSVHEGGIEAVFVEEGVRNAVHAVSRGEVAHLHLRGGDATGHVVMGPKDCEFFFLSFYFVWVRGGVGGLMADRCDGD
jgi:hypothetical protein